MKIKIDGKEITWTGRLVQCKQCKAWICEAKDGKVTIYYDHDTHKKHQCKRG